MLPRAATVMAHLTPGCIATICTLVFPVLYAIYQFSAAHFIRNYLPLLPDAALSCTFYAAFGSCMGVAGALGLLLRSPWLLLVFAHHLLLDALVSVVPSVMLLDLVRRSLADICEGGGESVTVAWCEYSSAGAAAGFGLAALALVVARVCIALATRQAALALEVQQQMGRDIWAGQRHHEKGSGKMPG